MSWDIFVQDIPESARSVSEIPDDFIPRPIGERSRIIAGIREVVPSVNFDSPEWGTIDGPDYSIEISLGGQEEVSGFAFFVRGGAAAAHVVNDILRHLGLRAFDTGSESGMFDIDGPSDGLREWRDKRDHVVGQ